METNYNEINHEDVLEVSNLLFEFPFNTSLTGFSMLTEAITLTLSKRFARVNMSKEIYKTIAKNRNINENSVEKGIKLAIDSVNESYLSIKELSTTNVILKNALINGKPKHFIMAVCEVIKHNRLKLRKI